VVVTENEQKQQLSIAYVHAVAAAAGCVCQVIAVDLDSVDVVLTARGWLHPAATFRSPWLALQLKATACDLLREETLAFPLPVKNYDELREASAMPRLLVVLLLPADPGRWLEQSDECMVTRHCAYWLSLLGQPALPNQRTVTVHLPRTQRLTPAALRGLMENASRREPL
jgi:hypothetical protein